MYYIIRSMEKLSLYKHPSETVKNIVLDLVGDGTKHIHSWNLWRKLRDNYKASLTAIQSRMSNLKELDGNLCYVGENPTGKVLFQELVERGVNV